jgi:hypothetical protein
LDRQRLGAWSSRGDDPQEGPIIGIDGDHRGKFDPDTIYIQLQDGRWVPIELKGKS